MKKIVIFFVLMFSVLQIKAQTSIFNSLLQAHVTDKGIVNYKSFKTDEDKLDSYISYLQKTSPDNLWSENKKRAFWINAYNAYTIKLILDNYPIASIIDIKQKGKTAWKIPFAKVGEKSYTLDYIEHKILRDQLFDPKIHVGLNCASGSCPKLGNKAFTEANIEAELTQLMKDFINDTTKNKMSRKKVQVSEIFNWFKGDFTKNGTLIDYLNKYSEIEIKSNAKVTYLKYDWALNGK